MKKELFYTLSPEIAFDEANLLTFVRKKLKLTGEDQLAIGLVNRSIDARQKTIKVKIKIRAFINEPKVQEISYTKDYAKVTNAPKVIIVGAGPAGLFAALRLIELGLKPIILERGKDVQARRHDLAAINKKHEVNPDSNYCFGEGGAGTYSDGKLYTRSKKRGDFSRILEILVAHGAKEDILVESHPHIGTNKLPKIIAAIRQSILDSGGEVHFNTKVEDFIIEKDSITGVACKNEQRFMGESVILATGHSARDIYSLLDRKKIFIEAKPFALGVRVEHQQKLIDSIQYKQENRGFLPAASYSLVSQEKFEGKDKGVFSFCMCPGGFMVPSATENGEIVVNGMSPSRRDSKYSNSGIVVSIDEEDWKEFERHGALAGMELQKAVEQKAFEMAGKTQAAPAQLLVDFVQQRKSKALLETSYQPGLVSVDLNKILPNQVSKRLRSGFKSFSRKMKGYLTEDAQVVGVESRTSAPVRITRDKESLEHVDVKRLFPCGEGAGYAGGIASAAIDGERVAESIAKLYGNHEKK